MNAIPVRRPDQRVPPPLHVFSAEVIARLREYVAALPEPVGALAGSLVRDPGKSLRSTVLGACALLGAHDPRRAARLGAVVELLHMASLLHDDVIDRAALRRGAPAAHVVAGNEMAMLAGLACFARAGTEAAALGGTVGLLAGRAVAELAYGELLDVERAFDTALTLPEYVELAERKTGELFRLSCVLGAAEARLGMSETRALASFGVDLGVAFQILDDCLDLGAAPGLGKPAGTDHMLGLFGAPTLCALREDRSGELAALLLSPTFGAGDLPRARSLIVARGGLTAAADLARRHHRRALAALDPIPHGEGREVLVEVAALVSRDPG